MKFVGLLLALLAAFLFYYASLSAVPVDSPYALGYNLGAHTLWAVCAYAAYRLLRADQSPNVEQVKLDGVTTKTAEQVKPQDITTQTTEKKMITNGDRSTNVRTSPKTEPTPKLFSEAEQCLVYDGADPAVTQKISNLVTLSKDTEEIYRLLWIEGDINNRSRLIERACDGDYQSFLKTLEDNFEDKLSKLSFTNSELGNAVITHLRKLQISDPLSFSRAYMAAFDLGDGLSIEMFKQTFSGPAKVISDEESAQLIEEIFVKSPPGEKLITILSKLGFECAVKWSISGGKYNVKANGKTFHELSYDELLYTLKHDLFKEQYQHLERSRNDKAKRLARACLDPN
jgi:hypothetical protein